MDSRSKWAWLLVVVLLLAACQPAPSPLTPTPTESELSSSPLPFEYIATPPDGQFILIALGDGDWTCVDGFCECVTVEAAAPPFDFTAGILQIDPYYLGDESRDTLLGTDLWPSMRKTNKSIGLFGFYGANTAIYLTFISSFPFREDRFGFEILGFDSDGSIQIKAKEGYAILPPNETYESEQPEQRSEECKVLNQLMLKNYGFIDDNNVVFSIDFAGYSGDFPP